MNIEGCIDRVRDSDRRPEPNTVDLFKSFHLLQAILWKTVERNTILISRTIVATVNGTQISISVYFLHFNIDFKLNQDSRVNSKHGVAAIATSHCQSTTRWRHCLLLPEKPLAVAYCACGAYTVFGHRDHDIVWG